MLYLFILILIVILFCPKETFINIDKINNTDFNSSERLYTHSIKVDGDIITNKISFQDFEIIPDGNKLNINRKGTGQSIVIKSTSDKMEIYGSERRFKIQNCDTKFNQDGIGDLQEGYIRFNSPI